MRKKNPNSSGEGPKFFSWNHGTPDNSMLDETELGRSGARPLSVFTIFSRMPAKAFSEKLWRCLASPTPGIAWSHDGKSVVITDEERFRNETLPSCFGGNGLRSPGIVMWEAFLRQLRRYGFEKTGRTQFTHMVFCRDNPHSPELRSSPYGRSKAARTAKRQQIKADVAREKALQAKMKQSLSHLERESKALATAARQDQQLLEQLIAGMLLRR